jgi:hypothetical protein
MPKPKGDLSQDTLGSFLVLDDEQPDLPILYRSEGERYANCPAQARLLAAGGFNTSSNPANAGEECHKAFGFALSEYIASNGQMSPGELVNDAQNWMLGARPDVQPDVIRGMKYSIYDWAKRITAIHADNILRFDGGEGDRSGWLAWDLPGLCRLGSELDLLYAGPSKSMLHELDYKSGWKKWAARDVAGSFQFQFHALLVLNNYPEVDALEVQVWNTRENRVTYAIEFTRKQLPEITARVRSAAQLWKQYHDAAPEKAPAWPSAEKCELCPVILQCPLAGSSLREVHEDPQDFLTRTFAAKYRFEEMTRMLDTYVDVTGQEISCETGEGYGYSKPKRATKPKKAFYQTGKKPAEEEATE